jgi:hypothetical protein
MPVPFLVPLIGGLVGTAAAPAIGMSAAVAAGLGSGIATLAAGGEPEEALLSGLGGGIASGLMPGVTSGVQGLAAKGGQAAAQGAAQGAGGAAAQGAAQGAGGAAADAVTRQAIEETTRKSLAATTDAMAKKAASEAGEKGLASMIDPKKAAQTTLKLASSSGGGQQQTDLQAGPLPMNLGGNQSATSRDALSNFKTAAAPAPTAETRTPAVEPIQVASMEDEKRIPLQKIQSVRRLANGGLTSLAQDEMMRRGMDRLPNLGDREQAYMMAQREFAQGGYIEGPGTGTSDDIDAKIYQDGVPVQEAALSDGEFVMTERAVKGAGNGDRKKGAAKMYEMMRQFEERAA